MRWFRPLGAVVAAVLGAATTAVPAPPAAAATASVSIAAIRFSPDSVQVQMGPAEPAFPEPHAHVQFFHRDPGVEHNVTFDDARVRSSGTLAEGALFDAVLTLTGTFTYTCTIHPSMQGTVVVTELPAPTTTTTTAPPPTTTTTVAPAPTAPGPAPTAPGPAATAAPGRTTRPPAPRTTAAPPTAVTTAPPGTVPVDPGTTVAEPTSTTTTTSTTTVEAGPSGDRARVAAASRREASSGSPWPRTALLILVLGAAAVGARWAWSRRAAADGGS